MMLTVAVIAVGVFGAAVVLPLMLVRRFLPLVLLADELEEYRREVLGLRAQERNDAEQARLGLHVARHAAQHGSSAA